MGRGGDFSEGGEWNCGYVNEGVVGLRTVGHEKNILSSGGDP